MPEHIINEAKRCLNCKVPKCVEGCPVKTPINKFIQLFLDNKIIEAGEMLFENNPLSVVCALVCPHELQCEGHCILGVKSTPVHISSIEYYISNYFLNLEMPPVKKEAGKKVALIGSGPAGITIAMMLARKGYDITIFELHDQIGGVLRYGIPDFRLPKALLDKLRNKLVCMGIKIRPNTFIGQTITIDDLFRDGYKAVFIGTGVWKPKALGIKGETLGHVHFAIDYLKNPEVYDLGNKVCIVGAGNVAMDVARTALRKGSREVYVFYRKGEDEIPALRHEIEYAKIDGVKFAYNKMPVEITDDGVVFATSRFEKDSDGNEVASYITGTEELFEADSVIIAISQGPRNVIVTSTKGIEIGYGGLVITDDSGRTTRDGVFASGDVVTGAKTVVEAVNISKKVAEAIDKYVTGAV